MKLGLIYTMFRPVIRQYKIIEEFYLFSISVFRQLFGFFRLKGIGKTVLLRQIMFTGSDALFPIAFISFSISILVILEVHQVMGQLGKGRLLYELLVLIVVRQLSSLFTAFVVIARSGSAISTELGNMVVHKEIELLNSFGLSPFTYLVVPRMMGVVVAMLSLTIYFNLVAIIGGALFAHIFYEFNFSYFLHRIILELKIIDFFVPVLKSFLYGVSIGLISCYQGLKVSKASTEVPQHTMNSVVYSVVSVIALNVGITIIYM